MLHIFLSNRPGDVRYGTTGQPVPGYELRIVGDDGEPGRRRARSASCRSTDRRPRWRTGTIATRRATRSRARGRAAATSTRSTPTATTSTAGRSDDMLKVGGIYVSPIEVESALDHASGRARGRGDRPRGRRRARQAAGVRRAEARPAGRRRRSPRSCGSTSRTRLAPYKYPRWIEFIDELPKTATGKIQRFKLRASAS